MGSVTSYLSLLLVGMRLIGGFPFLKRLKTKPVNKAKFNHSKIYENWKQQPTFLTLSNIENDIVFQKSSFWTCWTVIVGVAQILGLATGFWSLQYSIVGFHELYLSSVYAYIINDVVMNVTIAGIMVYVFYRRLLLRKVVEFFYYILRGRGNDVSIRSFPLSMILPLLVNVVGALSFAAAIIYDHESVNITRIITSILHEIILSFLGAAILLLLELVVFLSIHEYSCIITSLHSCLGDTSRDPGLKHHLEYQEIVSKVQSVSTTKTTHRSDAWAEPIIYSASNRDLTSPFDIEHRLYKAKERVTHVNKLLHLVNKYCGVPVTLIMLAYVISSIVSLYYMSFFFNLDAHYIAVSFTYTIPSLLKLIFLCNVPHSLEEKVVPQCLHVMPHV